MFDTIVDKITGYFDKNTIVYALFPNLIFWGITLLVIELLRLGLDGAVSEWKQYTDLSSLSQALLFIAFLLWITFCSYLTITLQPALIRLYEGYWPDIQPFPTLRNRMCSSWKRRWDQKISRDEELNLQRGDLKSKLEEKKSKVYELEEKRNQASELKEKRNRVNELEGEKTNLQTEIEAILTKIKEVDEERLMIYYELFYRYPTKQHSENPGKNYLIPMPTELGNIIKTAELYSLKRYHLDSVLIWPRLAPLLPKNFADYFHNTETALILMVTLSAFSLLFGIPISFLIGWISPFWLMWWIPLLITIVSLVLRLYKISILALISLSTMLLFNFNILQSWAQEIHTLSILLAIVLLISQLSYRSAVYTALDYGDKIRSAIDLYRFKVLEELNLQPPSNLEDELNIWDQVCGLLYRGYEVDPEYYKYIKKTTTSNTPPSEEK